MNMRAKTRKVLIGVPMLLVASGLVVGTAGSAGYGRYIPRYNHASDYLGNWSAVDVRARVDNIVVADTSGIIGRWNQPTFNMYIDQSSDIDIDTDIFQRNHADDCDCLLHGGRNGSSTGYLGNWSGVNVGADVSNAVIVDTSGLVGGANQPRFNLYIDQHTDIDIKTDVDQGNYN